MKKLIPFIAACLIASAAVVVGASTPSVFEMRLVLDAPSGNSQPMTLITQDKNNTFTNVLNIQNKVLLDSTALKSVETGHDALGKPVIYLDLTDAGAKQFAEISRQNIHHRLAIIINGQLCEAPVIQGEIAGGKVQISGTSNKVEVENLAAKLSSAVSKN